MTNSKPNRWQYVNTGISLLSLGVAISVLLFGNNVVGRLAEQTKNLAEQTKNLATETQQLKERVDRISVGQEQQNPIQQTEPPLKPSQCSDDSYNLCPYNISFADNQTQIDQVREWLHKTNSGYPTLADAIVVVMEDRKLIGNPVPLTIINDKNLEEHERSTKQPITNASDIDNARLETAIYKAWKEKNTATASQLEFQQILR